MLAGILLHIIKLKTTYSYESRHNGGRNQSLTSPNSRNIKPSIQNYKVPIKASKFCILDSEINFIVKKNINVSMSSEYLNTYSIFYLPSRLTMFPMETFH